MPADAPRIARLRRACLAIAALTAGWSCALSITGGFFGHLGPIRVSSRDPTTPLAIAALAGAAAIALSPAGARWGTLANDWSRLSGLIPAPLRAVWQAACRTLDRVLSRIGSPPRAAAGACALAAAVVALGIGYGAKAAGGSDSYGYVSYAHVWATGDFRIEAPLMADLADPDLAAALPAETLEPLGYRLRADRTLAPTYSPGLPMIMGAFERAGGRDAVFFVVPILAGLAVWATYLLGSRILAPGDALAAAALLAASPPFLQQVTGAPMSDVPAAAWWALALAVLPLPSRLAALGCGLAAGAAILIRPNLVPLALVPAAVLLWSAVRERRLSSPGMQRLLLFGAGVTPACLTVAWLNSYWFGSPFVSGYGPIHEYFSVARLPANASRYAAWLLETQTPIVGLAIAAPWLTRSRPAAERTGWFVNTCAAFGLLVFACYAFYLSFDHWSMLRLLMPAFPVMAVLTVAGMAALGAWIPAGARRFLVTGVVVYGLAFARYEGAIAQDVERRYVETARAVVESLPERGVFFAMQHSGSLRYYAGRPTIRYDFLPASQLDPALDALRRLGYHPYFLLEEWEEDEFRARHAATSRAGALDWPPLMIVEPGGVRIYEPMEKALGPGPQDSGLSQGSGGGD